MGLTTEYLSYFGQRLNMTVSQLPPNDLAVVVMWKYLLKNCMKKSSIATAFNCNAPFSQVYKNAELFGKSRVEVLSWSLYSLNLNIIETLWAGMDKNVHFEQISGKLEEKVMSLWKLLGSVVI